MVQRLGRRFACLTLAVSAAGLAGHLSPARAAAGAQDPPSQPPRFESRVDTVVVSATVTDPEGRFVPNLRAADFRIFEDGRPQTIATFSSERVPVSLGIVLDLSMSMKGARWSAARAAIERLLGGLLDPDDQVFLYGFTDVPMLLQGWTTRRDLLREALARVSPEGTTALYDTIEQAVELAKTGRHRKKALLVISDGNDNASRVGVAAVKRLIQQSDVLVYAIGIDVAEDPLRTAPPAPPRPPPGGGIPGRPGWPPPVPVPPRPPAPRPGLAEAPVDAAALRSLTNDSGGRTAIVRSPADLDGATSSVADELSRQYFLGYPAAAPADGQWHAIDVEVVGRNECRVRARRGYFAGPGGPPSRDTALEQESLHPPLGIVRLTPQR
jgi:VWFA-related protein